MVLWLKNLDNSENLCQKKMGMSQLKGIQKKRIFLFFFWRIVTVTHFFKAKLRSSAHIFSFLLLAYLGFDTIEINLVPVMRKAKNINKNLCDSFSVFLLLLHISRLATTYHKGKSLYKGRLENQI